MIGPALALFAQITAAQHFPQDCATPASAPAVVSRARLEPNASIAFRAMAVPETVYVGQQAEYQVAVFIADELRGRLRRTPTFFAPDMLSMLAYDLPLPAGAPPRRFANSRCYDVLVYRLGIFPLLAGRIAIPPAQFVYSLPLSNSFFSREESHEVRTDSTVVVALEPPVRGRPEGFSGAVGKLTVSAALDEPRSRIGDPVTLTVRVSGRGNVKLLPRPRIDVPWASLVPTGERVTVDSTSARIGGEKEFQWLLTPQDSGTREIPGLRYPYFDPDLRRYEVAETPALTLAVSGAPHAVAAGADTAPLRPMFSIRRHDRGPLPEPPYRSPFYWAALFVAPLPALVRTLRARPRRAPRPEDPALVMRRAARAGDPRVLRRTWLAAVAARLGVPVLTLTEPDALHRALRRAGVRADTAARARSLLVSLDGASFAKAGDHAEASGSRAAELFTAIDAEAIASAPHGPAAPGHPLVLMMVMVLSLAATLGASILPARSDFDAGVSAWERGDVGLAAQDFQRHVQGQGRSSPDAWANYGTAAWAVGDTVAAMHGWQRALRLDPHAAELRDRISVIEDATVGDSTYVPPVTPASLAVAALVLWWAAWLVMATKPRHGRLAVAVPVFSAALLGGAVSALLAERTQPAHFAVARSAVQLLATPETVGEPLARAEKGSLLRLGGRSGRFVRVTALGDRTGWVDAERLLTLSDGPSLFAARID